MTRDFALGFDAFLKAAYRGVLGRDPDAVGAVDWAARAAQKSPEDAAADIIGGLMKSAEYRAKVLGILLADASGGPEALCRRILFDAEPWRAHHAARLEMF